MGGREIFDQLLDRLSVIPFAAEALLGDSESSVGLQVLSRTLSSSSPMPRVFHSRHVLIRLTQRSAIGSGSVPRP